MRADATECVEELEAGRGLSADDDRDLWIVALDILMRDVVYDISQAPKRAVWIQLGVCSHWLRPHQTRWTADGGFALPAGYGDAFYGYQGLPRFDWSVFLTRDQRGQWRISFERRPSRALELRLTFPTRTARHQQAVIHSLWSPGTPANSRQKRARFYGFRRADEWELRATTDFPKEKNQ